MEDYTEPTRISEAHKAALARMFADEDFRSYLNHLIGIYNHNVLAATRANNADKARDYTSRFDMVKKLLENGKAMYSQAEKLRSSSLEELEAKKDATDKVKE